MKKFITFLSGILLLAICCICLSVRADAATEGYYTYSVSDGKATITDVNESIRGRITIPSALGGCPVTAIGNYAFSNCDRLTMVTIPNTVTTIGDYAFTESGVFESFTIPDSVTTIGEYAFADCFVRSVTIPNSVTVIGDYAFTNSQLSSVTIPDSITAIGVGVFYGCNFLTSVNIPDSVTAIGDYAFCYSNLDFVTIPDSVVTIGESAFSGDQVDYVKIGNSVTTIGDGAFKGCYLKALTIPDSVITIGRGAFFMCERLEYVKFGERIATIGNDAFAGCGCLTYVTIPNSVTTIGVRAFENCYSLTTVIIGDGTIAIGDEAFENCSSLSVVIIGNSVSEIDTWVFSDCLSLSSIYMPKSVEVIGEYSFFECFNLRDVYYAGTKAEWKKIDIDQGNKKLTGATIHYESEMPEVPEEPEVTIDPPYYTYTVISGEAKITDVDDMIGGDIVIPSTLGDFPVTAIGEEAFSGCAAMTSLTVPAGVTAIGENVFIGCSALTGIYVDEANCAYSSDHRGVLFNKSKTILIQAPGAIGEMYILPDGVTTIISRAFAHCRNLTTVVIPDTVDSIGSGAFAACSGLTEVQFLGDVPLLIPSVERIAMIPDLELTAYYPQGNGTWTQESMRPVANSAVWIAYTGQDAGDLDGIIGVREDDAIYLLQHILMPELFPVEQNVDFDRSGADDEDDAIYLLQHILMPELFPL